MTSTVGPFVGSRALAEGLAPSTLRASQYHRVFRDVYVHKHDADRHVRTRAALALHHPSAFASHHSAARVLRLPVPLDPDEHITVLDPAHRKYHVGIRPHVVTGEPLVTEVGGIRISHPHRLFIEMAGKLGLVDRVVLGDAMATVLKLPPDQLLNACRDSSRHYARRATAAAELVRKGVDSPTESKLRMLLVLAGFPEPKVNHKIYREDGSVLLRFDLSYPELRTIIEYDGRQHAESDAQWDHDIWRREWCDGRKWRVVVVRSKGLFMHQEQTLQRVAKAALDQGGAKRDFIVTNEWRRHFKP